MIERTADVLTRSSKAATLPPPILGSNAWEMTPRKTTTVPCYFRTHVSDRKVLDACDRYVSAYSILYARGTTIANLVCMHLCGSGATQSPFPRSPRYEPGSRMLDGMTEVVNMFMGPPDAPFDDVTAGPMKQVFWPERWPTETVAVDPRVHGIVAASEFADRIQTLPPNMDTLMVRTGWDNALNSMATKLFGNVQTTVRQGLVPRIVRYLEQPGVLDVYTPPSSAALLLTGPLRPMVMHDADYELVSHMRGVVGVPEDDPLWYPSKKAPFTREMFVIHLFLVRYGQQRSRAYLPCASGNRKFAYLDAQIFGRMQAMIKRTERVRLAEERKAAVVVRKAAAVERKAAAVERKAEAARNRALGIRAPRVPRAPRPPVVPDAPFVHEEPHVDQPGDDDEEEEAGEDTTRSLGELMGITPALFNARRTEVRRMLRRQGRRVRDRTARGLKLARRWARLGGGRMDPTGRIDSLETNGVGMRLAVKVMDDVDMARYVRRLPSAQEAAAAAAAAAEAKLSKAEARAKKKEAPKADVVPPCGANDVASGIRPLGIGIDLGVVKLMTAAISHDARVKPTTFTLTRQRYYSDMGYWRQQKWERARTAATPDVQTALDALSSTPGRHNGSAAAWHEYLGVQRQREGVLREEFVQSTERAKQSEVLFRKKRSVLARACNHLLDAAFANVTMECRRPLVIGVGDGDFKSSMRGGLAAPKTSLLVALKQAVKTLKAKRAGQEVVWLDIDEHKTTLCCSACGAETAHARVAADNRKSMRLRSCTQCENGGKLRDRDVQAARNMLWLALLQYFGLERPSYFCRPARAGPI